MKILKRCIVVIGFVPMSLYAWVRWIVTGRNPLDVYDTFIDWGTK